MVQDPSRREDAELGSPEALERSIEALFEGLEGAGSGDEARDGGDGGELPTTDSDDALDGASLGAVEQETPGEESSTGGTADPELHGEEKRLSLIPVGASLRGGTEEVSLEEWSFQEAATRLREDVGEYLAGGEAERVEVGARIRQVAWRLQEWAELDGVAEAVERLALASSPDDEEPLTLARVLLTPSVARFVAQKVGEAARDEERRGQFIDIVAGLGEGMAAALGDALTDATERSVRRTFIDALVALGEDARVVVEDMTFDERWFVVRNAMLVLREVAGERGVEFYTAALGHADPRVRREALLALAHVGGEPAVMLIPGTIADPHAEVRQAAAQAAGALKVGRAFRPLLVQLGEEEDRDGQAAILLALGQIGDPAAVPEIEKRAVGTLFSKPPSNVRVAAYRALAAIGTPHARQLVQAAVEDRDPEVRRVASQLASELQVERGGRG